MYAQMLLIVHNHSCLHTYVLQDNFRDEFLFCQQVTTQTRGIDIFDTLMDFFPPERIDSQRLPSICADGAPAMLRCRYGFVARVKQVVPHITNIPCLIHLEALAS